MKLFRRILSLTLALLLVSGIMMPSGVTALAAGRAHAEGIKVNTLPDKLEYVVGEQLDLTGLTVRIDWNNGKNDIFAFDEFAEKNITVTPAEGTELTTEGKNVITVSLDKFSDQFGVEVKVAPQIELAGISVNTLPAKLEYTVGEKLDLTGLTVKVHWNNDSSEIFRFSEFAEKNITVTPADGTELTSEGKNIITVSLDKYSDQFGVEVKNVPQNKLEKITVNTLPENIEYHIGQKLDLAGLTVKLHYSDGSSEIIPATDFAKHGIKSSPAEGSVLETEGNIKVTVDLAEASDGFDINVRPVAVSDITINTLPTKLEYTTGDKLDLAGLTVKLHYSDGGSSIFEPAEFSQKDITTDPKDGDILAEEGAVPISVIYTAADGSWLTASFKITVAAAPDTERVIDRIFGSTRYETALAISAKWDKADAVIIASGENFADALAATTLSAALDAPILLAGRTDNETILKEISRLGADKAYILGGEQAVGKEIEQMLTDAKITVTRLGGIDRYATAAAIAAELNKLGIKSDMAFIVSGESFADALSAGFAAAQKNAPILYTEGGRLNSTTAAWIEANGITQIIIIGGEEAVSAQTAQQLGKIADCNRISGADRYQTSIAVAREYFNGDAGGSLITIATGKNFPDALTGGAYAIRLGAPTLLVGDSVSDELNAYLDECAIESIIIFGGENAVSDEIAQSLK